MDVYDAFLSKVNEDDWAQCYTKEDMDWFLQDWRSILNSSLIYFKFPRCSLDIDEQTQSFQDSRFTQEEVQILANYMKLEWLKRTIDSWENIKTQYSEEDFSQANLLKTFLQLREKVTEESKYIETVYYRSIKKKPFNYRNLAGRHR